MSGSFLLSLFGGTADAGTTALLSTLYGRGARPAGSVSPFVAMRSAEANRDRDVGLTAARPEVKRAIEGFRAGVAKATTVDGLLRDPANALPIALRASIISVGMAIEREMDREQPDFAFLIEVNENIAAGLSGQGPLNQGASSPGPAGQLLAGHG